MLQRRESNGWRRMTPLWLHAERATLWLILFQMSQMQIQQNLCSRLWLMLKPKATLSWDWFPQRQHSTLTFRTAIFPPRTPLYTLLARNLSVVQSLQHCQPLHGRPEMPTNDLQHSLPPLYDYIHPQIFLFHARGQIWRAVHRWAKWGHCCHFQGAGRGGAQVQACHRQTLRYSWFQTGSRCLGRLWSKVWAQFARPLACQTPLNVQGCVSLHSTHGGNRKGSRRSDSESERKRVSELASEARELRRCGGSTVLSPPAIAHDMFVSLGFAHKHRVGSCHAEDLGRTCMSARQRWNLGNKGSEKAWIQFTKVHWKHSQVLDKKNNATLDIAEKTKGNSKVLW